MIVQELTPMSAAQCRRIHEAPGELHLYQDEAFNQGGDKKLEKRIKAKREGLTQRAMRLLDMMPIDEWHPVTTYCYVNTRGAVRRQLFLLAKLGYVGHKKDFVHFSRGKKMADFFKRLP
jgi:hypothetical protein